MKPETLTRFQGVLSIGLAVALVPVTSGAVVTTDAYSAAPPPAVQPVQPAPPASAVTPPVAPAPDKLSGTAREVVKLINSGVPEDVIRTYIENSPYTFNLSSDAVIELHNEGVSNNLTTAMLAHDRYLRQNTVTAYGPTPTTPAPQPPANYTAPTEPQSTDQYADDSANLPSDYYDQLSGYGNWNYVPDYGWGWTPSWGISWASYPWWIWGGGWWGWVPSSGWCWFPHNHFNHGFNHGFAHGFNHGFSHGFAHGFNSFNHFNGVNHFNSFNHFNSVNHFNSFSHPQMHAFSSGSHWGGGSMGGMHGGGGMHMGGGGHGGGGGHR